MALITPEQLLQIVPNLTAARAAEKAKSMNEVLPLYGITDKDVFEEYLANVAHETGGFRIREEGLNYTRAERIAAVWPSRFNLTGTGGKKDARRFVRNPRMLANEVYNGRMGNRIGTNDGWDFRGGGDPQLTGRETYSLFTADTNRRFNLAFTAQQWADKVRTEDYWATVAGGWFFEWEGLITLARSDRFTDLVRRWNGGLIGMEDRQKYYDRCKRFL